MMARKPRMLVAVALANKMARTAWAMLMKNENYRNPATTAARSESRVKSVGMLGM
jgi:transposase